MKWLVIFALALASASAEIFQRNLVVPVAEKEGRITNGNAARVGQFPHQVGLSLLKGSQRRWCGGSIISQIYVLTAAHCTDGVSSITVYLGATVRDSAEITHTVFKDNVITHSGWNRKTFQNDIAVVKIPSVTYSDNIQPIELPAISNSYSDYDGDYVIASGWGRISDSASDMANNLQWAGMHVIPNRECADIYGGAITSSNLCCATPGGVSTCNADSGGPLVSEFSEVKIGTLVSRLRKVQIGLVSFGAKAGCEKGFPAVFTRITNYLNWIEANTGVSY